MVDYHGEPCYAFAGEAEDLFPGEGRETEAELHEEAVLDAKAHFFEVLSDGDPSRVVGLSGAFVAYRWADGPMRHVVCMVPVSAVTVTPPVEEETSPTVDSVLPGEEAKPDGGIAIPIPTHPQPNQCTTNTP